MSSSDGDYMISLDAADPSLPIYHLYGNQPVIGPDHRWAKNTAPITMVTSQLHRDEVTYTVSHLAAGDCSQKTPPCGHPHVIIYAVCPKVKHWYVPLKELEIVCSFREAATLLKEKARQISPSNGSVLIPFTWEFPTPDGQSKVQQVKIRWCTGETVDKATGYVTWNGFEKSGGVSRHLRFLS